MDMHTPRKRWIALAALTTLATTTFATGAGATTAFSNTPLIATWSPPAGVTTSPISNSTGNSEPAIAFGADGAMAVDGLGWLPFQVNMWKGAFGSTPAYFGAMDSNLQGNGHGRTTLGDEDADVEITSAGTLLLADLNIVINHHFNNAQVGLDVTRCPAGSSGSADCTT